MLTLFSDNPTNRPNRISRRSFVQIGTCALGGISLRDLLQLQAAAV